MGFFLVHRGLKVPINQIVFIQCGQRYLLNPENLPDITVTS